MLHLVQTRVGLEKCKRHVRPNDDVVFIGDGVLHIENISNCRVLASSEDIDRCGVDITDSVERCTMTALVELTGSNRNSASWR